MNDTITAHSLFTLDDICTATGATIDPAASPIPITGVKSDSRIITAGNLYVALKGERVDGHDMVAHALAAGASYVMVERLCDTVPATQQFIVKDCLEALQQLAHFHRLRHPFTVVGITGSVGKTSTKEMLALCVGAQKRTIATQGNYNNHIGMPLTLVNVPADTEVVILEMGMNHAGEISLLSSLARPDISIITTVDAVHLEFFESVAGIAHAKAEIMDGMQAGAPIILPLDNPYYAILAEKAQAKGCRIIPFGKSDEADYRLGESITNTAGTRASIHTPQGDNTLQLQVVGEHLALNALAVLACVEALGLDSAQARAQLATYRDAKGRGNIQHLSWHQHDTKEDASITVLDDTYNASPASMRAAFARLRALAGKEHRTIAVLGDMKELGENAPTLHAELADSLKEHQIDALFCTGAMMKHLYEAARTSGITAHHFANNAALAESLRASMQDGDYILCKGSRSSHMEEVIKAIGEAL